MSGFIGEERVVRQELGVENPQEDNVGLAIILGVGADIDRVLQQNSVVKRRFRSLQTVLLIPNAPTDSICYQFGQNATHLVWKGEKTLHTLGTLIKHRAPEFSPKPLTA